MPRQIHKTNLHWSPPTQVGLLQQTRVVAPDHFQNLHDVLPPVGLRATDRLVRKVVPLCISTLGIHLELGDEQLRHVLIPVMRGEVVWQRVVDGLLIKVDELAGLVAGEWEQELGDLVGVEAGWDVDRRPAVPLAVQVELQLFEGPLDDVHKVVLCAEVYEGLRLVLQTVSEFWTMIVF